MVAETFAVAAADSLRYLTIGEGIALMVISGFSVIDAFVYAWPRRLRLGITLRWLGRFGLIAFGSYFTWQRLHHGLNWYTPWTCGTFTILLAGTWLTRDYEYLWKLKHRADDTEPDLRLREPL